MGSSPDTYNDPFNLVRMLNIELYHVKLLPKLVSFEWLHHDWARR